MAAARENLNQASKSTEFMAPPSFAFELMRTAVLGLAVKHAHVRSLINPRQTSAITYIDSPLNVADDPNDGFTAGPPPGAVLLECPLVWVDDRGVRRQGHITDLLHHTGTRPAFTALHFTRAPEAAWPLQALQARLANDRIPLNVMPISGSAHGPNSRAFALYGVETEALYLVRPDGHVMARWRHADVSRLAMSVERTLRSLA